MSKIHRLSEADLKRIVKKVLNEQKVGQLYNFYSKPSRTPNDFLYGGYLQNVEYLGKFMILQFGKFSILYNCDKNLYLTFQKKNPLLNAGTQTVYNQTLQTDLAKNPACSTGKYYQPGANSLNYLEMGGEGSDEALT